MIEYSCKSRQVRVCRSGHGLPPLQRPATTPVADPPARCAGNYDISMHLVNHCAMCIVLVEAI